jgi:hypothetical protein
MKVEDLAISLRARSPWEAVDLGFAMARRWRVDVYAAWFLATLPFVALGVLLFPDSPTLALVLLWWFKPWYDRALLFVYARAVFGEPGSARALLAAMPGFLNAGLLAHLTLWRLDPQRSFRLPVMQLEGLRGQARSRRFAVLSRRGGGHAMMLWLVCANLEMLLQVSFLALPALLLPEHVEVDWWRLYFGEASPGWWQWLLSGMAYAAMSLLEPAYVGGGFALYLNRRAQLEGWDIELAFRRLAARLAPLAAALLLMLLPPLMPAAEAQPAASPDPAEARRVAHDILQHEDFRTFRNVVRWQPRERAQQERKQAKDEDGWLKDFGQRLARLFEFIGWVLLLSLTLFLLHRFLKWRESRLSETAAAPPAQVAGLDIRPESLPADVAAAVRRLWEAGQPRAALSLLYRATLSALAHRHAVRLRAADTEGDVLRAAAGLADEPLALLAALTRLWQRTAYAHQLPGTQELTVLLEPWPRWFAVR